MAFLVKKCNFLAFLAFFLKRYFLACTTLLTALEEQQTLDPKWNHVTLKLNHFPVWTDNSFNVKKK